MVYQENNSANRCALLNVLVLQAPQPWLRDANVQFLCNFFPLNVIFIVGWVQMSSVTPVIDPYEESQDPCLQH